MGWDGIGYLGLVEYRAPYGANKSMVIMQIEVSPVPFISLKGRCSNNLNFSESHTKLCKQGIIFDE